jgi:hypothetical protein
LGKKTSGEIEEIMSFSSIKGWVLKLYHFLQWFINEFKENSNFHQLVNVICRNPSLGLVIKARACKGAGQE